MQEYQKLYIKRHVRSLIERGLSMETSLEKSYSVLDGAAKSNETLLEAKKILRQSGSLTKALHDTSVIKLDDAVLSAILDKEGDESEENTGDKLILTNMLDTEQTIDEIFSLLKTKLKSGLIYALWLSVFATLIFSIISRKVLPQFKEIFQGFGAELPIFTQLAINWQESILSPDIIGIFFVLGIGWLIYSLRQLSNNSGHDSNLIRIPFIRNILNYTACIHWLSQLKVMSSIGYSLENARKRLSEIPSGFEHYLPHTLQELNHAESIDNLTLEFNYQIHQLNQQAEKLINTSTRWLLSVVMVIVVSYIIFTVFASYLPIFQLGVVV